MDTLEVETRNPGFSNKTGVVTANQAYNSYLAATGQTKKGSKEKFKEWLRKQKESGNLDKALQAGKSVAQNVISQRAGSSAAKEIVVPVSAAEDLADPTKKEPAKILGMSIPVAIGVGILAIAAITTVAIVLYKKSKKTA